MTVTRVVIDKYESSIKQELSALNDTVRVLAEEACIDVFALDDAMLDRANELAVAGIAFNPFDHAILAGVLVAASRLWDSGERQLFFCEADSDLQPWDKYGNPKPPLRDLYDRAHVWVYSDFMLTELERRDDFE